MNNAISVKALQESKTIADALQDAGILGPNSTYEPVNDAAIAYGFRVKLKNPGVWVSVKKMYKEELGYSIRIYVLNRAVEGGRVIGEAKYSESLGYVDAVTAAAKVLQELQDFDYSFFDGLTLDEVLDDDEDEDADLDEDELEAESEALSIEANQS
jgi:hypothetical protein